MYEKRNPAFIILVSLLCIRFLLVNKLIKMSVAGQNQSILMKLKINGVLRYERSRD